MSAKKVSKYIRQQRRERRRAEKLREREAKQAAKTPKPQRSPRNPQRAGSKKHATAAPALTGSEQTQATGPAPRHGAGAQPSAAAHHSADHKHSADHQHTASHQTPEPTPALERLAAEDSQRAPGSGTRAAAVVVGLGLIAALAGSAGFDLTRSSERAPAGLAAHSISAPAVTERIFCPAMPGQPDSITDQGMLTYAERDPSATSRIDTVMLPTGAETDPVAQWAELSQESRGSAEDAEPGFTQQNHTQGSVLEIQPPENTPEDPRARRVTLATGFTYYAESGPLAGLAAAPCTNPQRNQWFLGPEVGSGAMSLLSLANPHDRPATVEITTYDREGDRGSTGATTVLVPEQSVRSVNLAGLTTDSATAVQVHASGAPVAAALQSARTSGQEGLGVELLPAQTSALSHVMPGVLTGADDDAAQLHLYIPGDQQATVELQVFDENSQVPTEAPGVFSAEAGRVAVLDLGGLESGSYDVVVRTDVPSLAAVRSPGDGEPILTETGGGFDPITGEALPEQSEEDPAPDFSWSASAAALSPGFGALLPRAASPEEDEAAPEGETAEDGDAVELESQLRLFAPAEEDTPAVVGVNLRLVNTYGTSTEPFSVELTPGAGLTLDAEELAERAEEAEIGEVAAVVVDHAEAPAYGTLITRSEDGRFTATALRPLTRGAQHVPLHIGQ